MGIEGCKNDMVDFDKYAKNQQGAEWCLPIIDDELNISDIINDSLHVTSNEDGFISIIYRSEVSSPLILEYLEIPEIDTGNLFNFEMPEYVPPGDSVYFPYSQYIAFDMLSDQKIKTIKFNSCVLHLTFECNLNRNANIVISIPGALKNGEPFSTTLHYTYDVNASDTISKEIDLSGYEVHFLHQEHKYNIMKINYEVYVYSNNEPNNSPYVFYVQEHFSNISISEFTGYAGKIAFPVYSDTISIELYKQHITGTIQFYNPIINIVAKNSISAPVSISFNTLEALFDDPSVEPIHIEGEGLPNEWIIRYPNLVNETETSRLTLNEENSNIKEVLNSAPDLLIIDASGSLNPESQVVDNYINSKSKVSITTEVELPLYGSTSNLILEDDYNFSFNNVIDMQSAEFKIAFSNAFPIDLKLQLYFIDEENNLLDSLFTDAQWIEKGVFDHETFHIIYPTKTVLISSFNHERMKIITNETTHIKVKARLNTSANTPVRIYSDNYFDFHLGIKYQK